MDRQRPAAGWGFTGFSLGILLLLTLFLYRDSVLFLGRLWSKWEGGGYEHGYLVLLISFYLVYSKRESLARLVPGTSILALFAVAACSFVWLVAAVSNVQLLQVAIILPLIVSVIWAVAGRQVALKMLLPVMYISLAVPLWDPLLPVLQEITATAAFTLSRIAGIPALLQDYIVTIPAGQLSIGAACSGLHYLLAALALGFFYAYLYYQGFRARLLVIGAAAGAAILANILRVFIIIYLAYVSDMQHPMVDDHLKLGWYLFGGLVIVLLLIDHSIYRKNLQVNPVTRTQPDINVPADNRTGLLHRAVILFAVAGLITLGPAFSWWVDKRIASMPSADQALPQGVSGWHGPALIDDSWSPVFHGATEHMRGYRKDYMRVLLYIGLYSRQSQGSELINDLNMINNPGAWRLAYPRARTTTINGRQMIESEMVSVSGQRRIVWYIYRVAGRYTTSQYVAKLLPLMGIITGKPRAGVIAVAVDFENDPGVARQYAEDFLREMGPALARLVDGRVITQESDSQR